MAIVVGIASGQTPSTLRCDLLLNSTPAPNANTTCLDLRANANDTTYVADNTTRIAHNGLVFCKNAFQITSTGQADIVFLMDNTGTMEWGDVKYCTYPGDPTSYRAKLIKSGITLERSLAVKATAAFISFNGPDTNFIETSRLEPLLNISQSDGAAGLANLDTLLTKPVVDSFQPNVQICNRNFPYSATWLPSFLLARSYLADTTRAMSKNQAIVFVTDGAAGDYGAVQALAQAHELPPLYGIFLGDTLDNQGGPNLAAANLKDIISLTGGKFFYLSPTDTLGMRLAMDTIVSQLVSQPVPPQEIVIRNNTAPNQASSAPAGNIVADSNGNMKVTLDSSLALNPGLNNFTVTLTLGDTSHPTYNLRIQENQPNASQNTPDLKCYEPANLTMVKAGSGYSVILNHSPSELDTVRVAAISIDTPARAYSTWGDSESIVLPDTSSSGAVITSQTATPYPFDGNAVPPFPSKGNGKLETDANGRVVLHWVHPRDPRDSVTYVLPTGSAELQNDGDYAQGVNASVPSVAASPIVIRLMGNPTCLNNCNASAQSFTADAHGYNYSSLNPGQRTTVPSFILRTPFPYRLELYVYDNFGNFVNKATDSTVVSTFPQGTEVINLVPVSKKGQQLGTGVYILRATITPLAGGGVSSTLPLIRFGYVHP